MLLLPAGLCIGAIEIILNLEADRVEHRSGRRIMNRAHAFWSFGFFVAGLLGAALSQAGISPQWHLALVVPLVALGLALLLGRFDAGAAPRRRRSGAAPPRFARPTWGVMLLVRADAVGDGARRRRRRLVGDLHARRVRRRAVRRRAGGRARRAGAGGDALLRRPLRRAPSAGRWSRACCSACSAPARCWCSSRRRPGSALVGFALMGVGTSAIFPLAMSAAAQRTDRAAATNVAALAQISFVAFLLGPPLLGYVAQAFGIRWSFGIGLPLVAISLAAVGALRPVPGARP